MRWSSLDIPFACPEGGDDGYGGYYDFCVRFLRLYEACRRAGREVTVKTLDGYLWRARLAASVGQNRNGARDLMAKGNDGNYLQHSVEVAVATHLVEGRDGIHVALSHGMAPFESSATAPPAQLTTC